MARLNAYTVADSEDELPDLCSLLLIDVVTDPPGNGQQPPVGRKAQRSPRKGAAASSPRKEPNRRDDTKGKHDQRKLEAKDVLQAEKNTIKRLPAPVDTPKLLWPSSSRDIVGRQQSTLRLSPRRKAKANVDYARLYHNEVSDSASCVEEDDSFTDLSGFIVSDSESVGGEESNERREERVKKTGCRSRGKRQERNQSGKEERDLISDFLGLKTDDNGPSNAFPPRTHNEEPVQWSDSTEPHDEPAVIRYSPPRSRSPHKIKIGQPNVTPPSSPSKSQLQSPSKKIRIPPTPHRPSIDAFWSQELINDWNDQYSPRKSPATNRRNRVISLEDSDGDATSRSSPRKSPSKSPTKPDKAAIARRKAFNSQKHDIAASFLAEVDQTITNGQVSQLAKPTGGIKLVWSKKLSSTAGRANWRRETVRHRSSASSSDGSTTTASAPATSVSHHASIELAEKVIDDENRLINVIAHEYCHLANFMVSHVKNNPHGKEFKAWATKCTRAFGDRGVEVTTKHSYDISYKYIWQCSNPMCGIEYKRHSKSVDPGKHNCGGCKGKLLQVLPVPRKGQEVGSDGGKKKRSEYQEFVKVGYERVRRNNPGMGFGEVMAILGREFREMKAKEKDGGTRVVVQEVPEETGRDGADNDDVDGVLRKMNAIHLVD